MKVISRNLGFTHSTEEPDRCDTIVVLRQVIEHPRHLCAVLSLDEGYQADARRVRAVDEHRDGVRNEVQAGWLRQVYDENEVVHVATDGRRLTRVHRVQELVLVSSAQERTHNMDLQRIEMAANVRSCAQVRRQQHDED